MAKSRNIKDAFGLPQTSKAPHVVPKKPVGKKSTKAGLFTTPRTEDFQPLDSDDEPNLLAPSEANPDNFDDFVVDFEHRLNRTLKALSQQITLDIQKMSQRLTRVERKTNDLESTCEELASKIVELEANQLAINLKMEDTENRSRRSNLRIRGIPETLQDPTMVANAIFQDLAPNLTGDRLELDRAHRALAKIRPEGPPRDIIVKCHFFRTKDMLLHNARERASSTALQFQGHPFQLFADISPATIARRREMKPFLAILQTANIPYKWGFPFKIIFSYKSRQYTASSVDELKETLAKLGLSGVHSLKRSRIPGTPDASTKKKSQGDHHSDSTHGTVTDPQEEMN